MQATSQVWKDLFAAGAALEARAVIGGAVYEDISAPVIHRAAMQNALSIGNVAAASLSLAVRFAGSIPRSAAVVIEARLNDGQTASEWLPQGTFYISRRARDPVTGLLALECYDALLKANAPWTPSAGAWPRTMAAVVTELAGLLGLALDSRTVVPSGVAFMVAEPQAGTTIRDALGSIAQAGCGNWIVTPANRLRLVALDEAGATLDVAGVVGGMDAGAAGSVTGVRCSVDGASALTGDDTGIVVDVSIAPVIAAEVADRLIGLRYQPFDLTGAIVDPAAELGDGVSAGANGEIASALWTEQLILGPAVRGNLSAPEAGEVTDEYPYIGSAQRTLTLAKAAVAQAVGRLDDALTQQEIFNRLTDNGAAQGLVLYDGQLYINASYIQSGTLTLGGVNNANGTLVVQDASGNVVGHMSNGGFSFQGSNSRYGLFIDPGGNIALGEKPDSFTVLDGKAFIQLMSGGVAKVANLYFATGALGARGMIGPMDGGGLFICGPGGASEFIAKLSTDEADILSDNTRLEGDLRVVGQTRLNHPLDSFYGGTGVSLALPPSLLVNLNVNTADNVFKSAPRPGVTGTLGIANGGTGATTPAGALQGIGAAAASTHRYNFYTDPSQLGLSGSNTVLQIFNALPNYSVIITPNGLLASDMPNNDTQGELMIVRTSGAARSHILYYGKGASSGTWRMYLGATAYNNNNANAPSGVWYRIYDEARPVVLSPSQSIPIPSAGSSASYNLAGLTADHVLTRWNFSTSAENVPPASLTWTTYAGYFTIANNGGATSESVKPVFELPKAVAVTNH